jgi:O-antigen/teichoic acid export membrane protein
MISARINRFRDRVNLRTYTIIKNAVYSLGIKGCSIIIGLLLMPVYAKFLINQSVLGVWLTLVSMLSWIFMFDLGIGNGLRNELTIAIANNNRPLVKKLISSAYVSSIVICFIMAVILCIGIPYIDFIHLFNIDTSVINEKVLSNAVVLLSVSVLTQFVLKLVNSILLALQKSAIPNALNLLSNILLLVYLLIAPVHSINSNFALLSVIYAAVTNLPVLIATVIIFSTTLKDCKPSIRDFNISDAKKITKLGLAFFWLQIMIMIIGSMNNFLISIFINAGEVVTFQVYYRLFTLVSVFFSVGMIPVWSSITDAQAKKDFQWIVKIRKHLYKLMGIAAVGEVIVLLLSKYLVAVWMGQKYVLANNNLIIFFALSDLAHIWTMINAQVANGLGKLKNQLLFLTSGALIYVPLAYLFSTMNHSWAAIVFANIIALLPFCISETFSTTRYLRRLNAAETHTPQMESA